MKQPKKVMQKQEPETFCPKSRQEWRRWLETYHSEKQSVWLICYKKQSNLPTVTWSEAVEEALCFGWIDSIRKPIDNEKFTQFFCKRKANSAWSKINKAKIEQLTDAGLMTEKGLKSIEIAKQNGCWTILDEVEELMIPPDLANAFKSQPGSELFFLSLSKSVKKSILQWLVFAKRPETRQKRIIEIAGLAAQKLKPKQF